ncbi:hypothetical protein [Streptomyces sp. CB02400]|nr:hypothetical protein [Streptomyces sp. CB02400]
MPQRLHVGLRTRALAHGQVRTLFRELREQSAYIGTSVVVVAGRCEGSRQ